MEKFSYRSSSGKCDITAYAWFPQITPKGLVYFAHGIMEYAERHASFFETLTNEGYIVVANDHMGHGDSQHIFPMSFMGRIGVSGWDCACNDAYLCIYNFRKKFNINKNIPLYGMGFSLGSFIIRTVAIRNPSLFDGLILLGTGNQSLIKTKIGKMYAEWECNKYGRPNTTPNVSKLTFGAFNKHFRQNTIADWFCLNKKSRDQYLDDDRCGKEMTAGLFYDVLCGIEYTGDFFNIKRMNPDMPILLLSGSRDPVGDFSKGIKSLHRKFRYAGLNATCILYNHMRHDLLHELDAKTIKQDIVDFLNERVNTKIKNTQLFSI